VDSIQSQPPALAADGATCCSKGCAVVQWQPDAKAFRVVLGGRKNLKYGKCWVCGERTYTHKLLLTLTPVLRTQTSQAQSQIAQEGGCLWNKPRKLLETACDCMYMNTQCTCMTCGMSHQSWWNVLVCRR
jgi:hypothetical protein